MERSGSTLELEGPKELPLEESHLVSDGKSDKECTLERLVEVGDL